MFKNLIKTANVAKTTNGVQTVRTFASGTSFEKFNFEDPFKLDSLLTDEERAISEAAK